MNPNSKSTLKREENPSTLPCKPRTPYRHHIVLEQLCRRSAQLALTDCLNVWRLLCGEGRGGVVTCIQVFWKGTEMETDCESSRATQAPPASPSPAAAAQESLEERRGTWASEGSHPAQSTLTILVWRPAENEALHGQISPPTAFLFCNSVGKSLKPPYCGIKCETFK